MLKGVEDGAKGEVRDERCFKANSGGMRIAILKQEAALGQAILNGAMPYAPCFSEERRNCECGGRGLKELGEILRRGLAEL